MCSVVKPPRSGNRFWIENAEAYLAPLSGTFVYSNSDPSNRTVLYAPTAAEISPAAAAAALVGGVPASRPARAAPRITAEVVAPRLVELVVSNQANVRFANVRFEHSAVDFATCFDPASPNHCGGMGQGAAFLNTSSVRFENGSVGVELVNVTVAHTGGYGVWFQPGARDSAVRRSRLVDLGAGGVRAGGSGHNAATGAGNVTVEDCTIAHGGRVFAMGMGVLFQSVWGSSVVHTEVYDFYQTGISLGWSWHYVGTAGHGNTVAFNRVHTIGQGLTSDMGCIYHLGVDHGTTIAGNVCSNVTSFTYGAFGVYLDQASSGVTVANNTIYDTQCSGIFQHYGLDNVYDNNVVAYANTGGTCALQPGAIGSGTHDRVGDEGDRSSLTLTHNIVLTAGDEASLFMAATANGWANTTADRNVYWNARGAGGTVGAGLAFPCKGSPSGPSSHGRYMTSYQGAGPMRTPDYISSPDGGVIAQVGGDGSICVLNASFPRRGAQRIYCSPGPKVPRPAASYAANMQGDGNLCVHADQDLPGTKPIWCDQQGPFGPGDYFADVSNGGDLCVHRGTAPVVQATLWCSSTHATATATATAPWPARGAGAGGSSAPAHAGSQGGAALLGVYPCTCPLAAWRASGHDRASVLADPLFVNASGRDFRLRPSSPALKLGIRSIDSAATAGPRGQGL